MLIRRLGHTFAVMLVLALPVLALPVHAQDAGRVDLTATVPGHDHVSWFDLVRLMLPDVEPATNGQYAATPPKNLRHIDPEWVDDEDLSRSTFFGAEAAAIKSDGKDRTVLLVDFGTSPGVNGFAILGLFGFDGSTPVLLDAVNVALDRDTVIRDGGILPIGEGETVLVSASYHHNSSQGYEAIALTLVREDRFESIDTLWLINNRYCGYEQVESPSFTAKPGAGPFGDIDARVTDSIVHITDDTCGDDQIPPVSTRDFSVTYRWDEAAQKYQPDSDAFDKLATINEDRT